MSQFLHKSEPYPYPCIAALMEEPADVRARIAGHLREFAREEVGDRDPLLNLSLIDAADIIQYGCRQPQGARDRARPQVA